MLYEAVLTYSVIFLLTTMAALAIWMLPWSDKDLEATDRGFRALATILITRIRGWWG